jgi:carbonic anhydrase
MSKMKLKWILLGVVLLAAPLWARERTGILAPPDVKKEQDLVMKTLMDGNKAHVKHIGKIGKPMVMVISCADSHVPPETVFHLKTGEIFTNRAWGNMVDKVILGSLEYGADTLKCRVLVVLGHTECTALMQAIEEHKNPRPLWRSLNMQDLNERLQPAVEAVTAKLEGEELLDAVVRANVLNTMRTIREQSPALWQLEQDDMLKIVGAIYHKDTGVVEWLKE